MFCYLLSSLDLSQGSFPSSPNPSLSRAHTEEKGCGQKQGTDVTNPQVYETFTLPHKHRATHGEPSRLQFPHEKVRSPQPPGSHMYHIPEKDEQYSGLEVITQLCCHLL